MNAGPPRDIDAVVLRLRELSAFQAERIEHLERAIREQSRALNRLTDVVYRLVVNAEKSDAATGR